MKISSSHQKFADRLNNQTALEYPERFLGPNWKDVLNFWIYLDTLSREELDKVYEHHRGLKDIHISRRLAWCAAKDTIGYDYTNAAAFAYYVNCYNAAGCHATSELIGSHKLETLTFFPLFINF